MIRDTLLSDIWTFLLLNHCLLRTSFQYTFLKYFENKYVEVFKKYFYLLKKYFLRPEKKVALLFENL